MYKAYLIWFFPILFVFALNCTMPINPEAVRIVFVVARIVAYLETWSTPERVAEGQQAAIAMHNRHQEKARAQLVERKQFWQGGINK